MKRKVKRLTLDERAGLVEDGSDSIAGAVALTPTQRMELDRRLEAYELDRNPGRLAQVAVEEVRRSLASGVLAFCTKVHHVIGMLDWSQCPVVERSPGKVSGAWLFKNTRVPVKALFENLEGGATVQEFLEYFPGVSREQVEAVLEYAQRSLEAA
jgi:putative addiction module component (TIGR02574 family)